MADGKAGRPEFKVTKKLRDEVEQYVACGMSHAQISRAVGCSEPTLRKHFETELDLGASKKRAEVIALMFKNARAGNATIQKQLVHTITVAMADAQYRDADGGAKPGRQNRLGKKEEAAAEAASVAESGGIYSPPSQPKLVVNNS